MRGGLEDTICAIATPAGEGGIGIVRLSGSQALTVASGLVRLRSGQSLASVSTHTLHLADLLIDSSLLRPESTTLQGRSPTRTVLDEALVVFMKAPRSFTGEDVVEFQSHGGGLVLSLLCEGCVEAGARLAEPGEFTKRAFLNGRLDLSQAEAVLDTIRARSGAGLAVAQRQLRGELAREVETARMALLGILTHVEAGIDFVDEDISFIQKDELERSIGRAAAVVRRLQATAQEGRILREGARVVILGRPNVGKSSLMNRLLKEDRAIVTPVPGTTRDVIEESIVVGGVLVHLVDTAGIRDTEDVVEREGVRRSRSAQEEADLQLIVIDGSGPLTAEDHGLIAQAAGKKHVIVINKSDLPLRGDLASIGLGYVSTPVSAKTGRGIEELKSVIRTQLVSGGSDSSDGVMVTNVRHRTALKRASVALAQAALSVANGMAGELVAIDVRGAADALGEITGVITTDEILDRIFSEFCIGK
jgi:tRNA modification GTPase